MSVGMDFASGTPRERYKTTAKLLNDCISAVKRAAACAASKTWRALVGLWEACVQRFRKLVAWVSSWWRGSDLEAQVKEWVQLCQEARRCLHKVNSSERQRYINDLTALSILLRDINFMREAIDAKQKYVDLAKENEATRHSVPCEEQTIKSLENQRARRVEEARRAIKVAEALIKA